MRVMELQYGTHLLQTSATRNPYGNPVTDDWE